MHNLGLVLQFWIRKWNKKFKIILKTKWKTWKVGVKYKIFGKTNYKDKLMFSYESLAFLEQGH